MHMKNLCEFVETGLLPDKFVQFLFMHSCALCIAAYGYKFMRPALDLHIIREKTVQNCSIIWVAAQYISKFVEIIIYDHSTVQ